MSNAGRSQLQLTGGEGDVERSGDVILVDMGQDLLTPTSTIIAYTEMLLDCTKKEPALANFVSDLEKMAAAAEQLATLITHLFSKPQPTNGLSLEELSSAIRHDLRTPINAIIGYGEMLLEDTDGESYQEIWLDLQKILTTARRLLTLISDLIYFPKSFPEAKKPEQAPVATTFVDEMVDSVRLGEQNHLESLIQAAELLVVDDKESNRDLLSRRLDRQGFHVAVAENGQCALQMLHARSYDLILLDVIMPEMNGYQVLAELKRDEKLRHIPVIMISALDEIDSVVRCIDMGAEDYLQKPFNQVILKAKISASLERKRLRDLEQAYLHQLQIEQDKSEKLLLNILPKPIAERLKKGAHTIADNFPDVTILFSDLVGFTKFCSRVPPQELIEKLNEIFLAFDRLTEVHNLEKIKTIGDAYMLVGGLPTKLPNHAEAVANMALDMIETIKQINRQNNDTFEIRVGIHTGSVVAGVIGKKKFNYDLWGDAVNVANRMESHGVPGKIQVTETTYERIKDKFILEHRGPIEVKGKGQMITYFLTGRK
ncbi:MAG: hypothetical protein BWK79_11980 [Beggiatoa sp. IS2]|nr:MAG: hypothetical protein BWK79_11980 [Beggiatoa sp. IS2]